MSAFTGRSRKRITTRSVKFADAASRVIITLGGLGTIVAVSTIAVFLVWVVVPLFQSSTISDKAIHGTQDLTAGAVPVAMGTDPQMLLGWMLLDDGQALSFRIEDGVVLERLIAFETDRPRALDVTHREGAVAAGFADGSVQFGRIGIQVEFLEGDEEGIESLELLEPGEVASWGRGLVQRTPEGQLRQHTLQLDMEGRVETRSTSPVQLIDQTTSGTGSVVVLLREDGSLELSKIRRRKNLLTGEVTTRLVEKELPYEARSAAGPPEHLLVSELGADVYVGWSDGLVRRFNTQGEEGPALVETTHLTEEGRRLTSLEFMIGRSTLMAGDDSGRVRGWFQSRREEGDHPLLVAAHEFRGSGSPVTMLATSGRTRTLAAGFEDGSVRVFHMTTGQVLAETRLGDTGRALRVAIAPRDDGVLAVSRDSVQVWKLNAQHPETTFAALFLPVWYEGESDPGHVWQSTGGTDDFEPKLSLFPLIFGTLKATFYSLIFSVPLAILAAIYTSEFLSRRVRERVKQIIEMMATLPSVVLGFLAAIVLAPFIERSLPGVLAAFLAVPLLWLLGAQLWQLLPHDRAIRWGGWPRLTIIALVVPVAAFVAFGAGPLLESWLFAGNMRAWLDGQAGRSFGGWVFVLLPVCGIVSAWLSGRHLTPRLRSWTAGWERRQVALLDLGRFFVLILVSVAMSMLAALLLDTVGLDPRTGPVVGQMDLAPTSTYVQRNALIVGFVMGFAVVPIIYTLAEDALSAVPDHLRAASLATGATPWQTAVRVVVPTAMSGLFSACMIGLGRAVGETMVVLMAAGNTPLLEANMFNGFRTLSANIAVELPEAVQDGSLYRVLFLAALTLFAMTFVVNTAAEVVRMRFRKRAYEL